jgi:NAD+ diphosphatase
MTRVHTFAGSPLDRAANFRRDSAWLKERMLSPAARYLALHQLKAGMQTQGGLTIRWRNAAEVAAPIAGGATVVFLGLAADGKPCFAVDAGDGPQPFPDGKFVDVRAAAATCPGDDAAILAQARSLIDWHARHRFCAVCGHATELREGGYSRQCLAESCKAQHFPRTDPVTIMLVVDGDKVLLGRQARFLPGVYSALAGFVEPGETIEEAVRREVKEEAGIDVGRVRYHSSQPWPFSSSLMIGCIAEATSTAIERDAEELEDIRWFERAEIARMVEAWREDGQLRMPAPLAIAHQLARGWLSGE